MVLEEAFLGGWEEENMRGKVEMPKVVSVEIGDVSEIRLGRSTRLEDEGRINPVRCGFWLSRSRVRASLVALI